MLWKNVEMCCYGEMIYKVINTIANYSKKLFMMINDWKSVVNEPDNDAVIAITTS